MRYRPSRRAAAALIVAAALAAPPALPSAAEGEAPALFTVLQAAFYSFSQTEETNQSAAHRAVLLEQAAPAQGAQADLLHESSGALLNATSRSDLVLVEYQMPAGSNPLAPANGAARFADYYKATSLPTAIFDGTGRTVAFGANTPQAFQGAFDAASSVPASASIRARGGIVLQNGYLDAAAEATADVSASRVYLRAIIVEDLVDSPTDGTVLRYIARADLGALRVESGRAAGRFNFTIEPPWTEGRLGAVLYVQSDGPTEGAAPPLRVPARDSLTQLLSEGGPFLMLGTLGALIALFARHERRRRR